MTPTFIEQTHSDIELATIWHDLVEGRLFVTDTFYRAGRCYAALQSSAGERPGPAASDAQVLERVLFGEAQKVLALEFGVSTPTICLACTRALRAITCEHAASRAPLLVVMAAFAARGLELAPARVEFSLVPGSWVVSVPLPGQQLLEVLTPGEQEVAQLAIEGKSHAEIARTRGTSHRTVANQVATIFRKLGVSGRSVLRAKAVTEHAHAYRVAAFGAPLS